MNNIPPQQNIIQTGTPVQYQPIHNDVGFQSQYEPSYSTTYSSPSNQYNYANVPPQYGQIQNTMQDKNIQGIPMKNTMETDTQTIQEPQNTNKQQTAKNQVPKPAQKATGQKKAPSKSRKYNRYAGLAAGTVVGNVVANTLPGGRGLGRRARNITAGVISGGAVGREVNKAVRSWESKHQ